MAIPSATPYRRVSMVSNPLVAPGGRRRLLGSGHVSPESRRSGAQSRNTPSFTPKCNISCVPQMLATYIPLSASGCPAQVGSPLGG
jgi:hypothetical protein